MAAGRVTLRRLSVPTDRCSGLCTGYKSNPLGCWTTVHPMPRRFTSILLLPALAWSAPALVQEGFKRLGEREIRERVIGKDIVDSYHWVTFPRSDGVLLIVDEAGRKQIGTWKIRKNELCMSTPNGKSLDCNEVWMSGDNIRLRARKNEETFDAIVEKHKAD